MASSVDAAVTNGGVEIELANAPHRAASIDLESVNGGVSLSLPADSKADITARCVNGGISVNGLDLEIDRRTDAASARRQVERRRRAGFDGNGQRRRQDRHPTA